MKNNELKYELDDITTILAKTTSKDVIFNFLRDLLTEKEILEFSRRFEVAKMLEENISYSIIEKKTAMSSTTIARVSKFLKGENTWYKSAISLLQTVSKRHHTGHHS